MAGKLRQIVYRDNAILMHRALNAVSDSLHLIGPTQAVQKHACALRKLSAARRALEIRRKTMRE
jgi:hypothetical protein